MGPGFETERTADCRSYLQGRIINLTRAALRAPLATCHAAHVSAEEVHSHHMLCQLDSFQLSPPVLKRVLGAVLFFRLLQLRHRLSEKSTPKVNNITDQLNEGGSMADLAKEELIVRLLEAKKKTNKTFTQIARETGHTNAYIAQLFHRQATLRPGAVEALQRAVPALTNELIEQMQEIPLRTFDPDITQDPTIYRLYEAVMQYAVSLKAIINEEAGDGIMSAIGFYCDVGKVKGKEGEDRIVVSFNGKYLPHVEQRTEDNVAPVSRLAAHDG